MRPTLQWALGAVLGVALVLGVGLAVWRLLPGRWKGIQQSPPPPTAVVPKSPTATLEPEPQPLSWVQQPQNLKARLSAPQRASFGPYGGEIRILTVEGKEIGCVADYQDLPDDLAAIQTCTASEEVEALYAIEDWRVVNLATGEQRVLELPRFDAPMSSPAFRRSYVAYWGFDRESAKGYAMVVNWKTGDILYQEPFDPRAIDFPYPPPQWVPEIEGTQVDFALSEAGWGEENWCKEKLRVWLDSAGRPAKAQCLAE